MVRIYRAHNNWSLFILIIFAQNIFTNIIYAILEFNLHLFESFCACQFLNEILIYCQMRNPNQNIFSMKIDAEVASSQKL